VITGLNEFAMQLGQASQAFKELDGELTTVSFNPLDQASIEAAISQIKEAINSKIAPYRGNEIVEQMATAMIEKYTLAILDRASNARLKEETENVVTFAIDSTILRQIENAVTDLRSSEHQTFGKHIKKLSRLLHLPELELITSKLVDGIDLDAWIRAGHATERGMVGTAELEWPTESRQELGTVVLLIDRFAANPDDAVQFALNFYYSGNNINANLQNMVRQVIVPFARDFIDHVKRETGVTEPTLLPARTGPAARKVFVVHGHDEGARESVRDI